MKLTLTHFGPNVELAAIDSNQMETLAIVTKLNIRVAAELGFNKMH